MIQNDYINKDILEANINKISYTLDKEYLSNLVDEYSVLSFDEYKSTVNDIDTGNYAGIRIKKFIFNKDEKIIDCMKNVLSAFSNTSDTLAYVIHRTKDEVSIDLVYKKDGENVSSKVTSSIGLLRNSIEGNFKGSSTGCIDSTKLNENFDKLKDVSISLLSSIPSDKSEEFLSQGIEKLLNGVVPKREDKSDEYTVVILAKSMAPDEIRLLTNGFEEMATEISPFESHQFRIGKSENDTDGEMSSATNTEGVSHAISKTHSINIGMNLGGSFGSNAGTNSSKGVQDGTQEGTSHTISEGEAEGSTHNEGTNTQITQGEFESKGVTKDVGNVAKKYVGLAGTVIGSLICPGLGTAIGGALGSFVGDIAKVAIGARTTNHGTNRGISNGSSINDGTSKSKTTGSADTKSSSKSHSETITDGIFNSISRALNVGLSAGYGYSWGNIDTTSTSDSLTKGTNKSISLGKSNDISYTYKSYLVKDLLEKIDGTIKRINNGKAVGFWNCAVYVLSEDVNTSINVANFLRGLSLGDESYLESSTVQTWDYTKEELKPVADEIKKYIMNFTHPVFFNTSDSILLYLKKNQEQQSEFVKNLKNAKINKEDRDRLLLNLNKIPDSDLISILPTTRLSTTELAKIFSLPTHSLPGLPVLECAEFGRNVSSYDDSASGEEITIGKIYHMHNEESLETKLKTKSLTSHTFITGSTGSGKSNTSYVLLNELIDMDKKFLVIEPAKGEYKHVLGSRKDVSVYGTNPQKMPLLRINPFSFPKDIHILEHLDRLVEIFNVCWPMYAAMPAVLKEAVEKSYEDAGWNLTESMNEYGEGLYPTFADVTRNIRTIIDSSEYDAENKGAYKGSLITRLKSLTNGINGLIFTTDELSEKELFDENVIIDLSRVGSSETKSLIMGLLVLKLQEYRMSMTKDDMNSDLRHVTVLEEAHNLLKRTSTEQSSESANLLGKSVEMLTNAIAEMRTYGEGFIIADQAPGLLDMAVIRNTNTKIIMRLPDLSDRELVGKAANLNDNQIEELAKLPCGVAAVYQNEWVQPVLCKVNKAKVGEERYKYTPPSEIKNTMAKRIEISKILIATPSEKTVLEELRNKDFKFSGSVYVTARKYVESLKKKPNYDNLSQIVSEILPEFVKTLKASVIRNPGENIKIWRDDVQEHIEQVLRDVNESENMGLRNHILQCILQNYVCNEIRKPQLLNELRGGAK